MFEIYQGISYSLSQGWNSMKSTRAYPTPFLKDEAQWNLPGHILLPFSRMKLNEIYQGISYSLSQGWSSMKSTRANPTPFLYQGISYSLSLPGHILLPFSRMKLNEIYQGIIYSTPFLKDEAQWNLPGHILLPFSRIKLNSAGVQWRAVSQHNIKR